MTLETKENIFLTLFDKVKELQLEEKEIMQKSSAYKKEIKAKYGIPEGTFVTPVTLLTIHTKRIPEEDFPTVFKNIEEHGEELRRCQRRKNGVKQQIAEVLSYEDSSEKFLHIMRKNGVTSKYDNAWIFNVCRGPWFRRKRSKGLFRRDQLIMYLLRCDLKVRDIAKTAGLCESYIQKIRRCDYTDGHWDLEDMPVEDALEELKEEVEKIERERS